MDRRMDVHTDRRMSGRTDEITCVTLYYPITLEWHENKNCISGRLKSIVGHTPEHKSWYTFLCTENTQAIDFFLENYDLYKQSIYVAQNIYWTGVGKKVVFCWKFLWVYQRSYWPTHERTDGWNYMCNSILPNHTRVTWKQELYFSYVLRGLLIICKNTLRVEQDHDMLTSFNKWMSGRLRSIVGHIPELKSWHTFLCTENTQAIDFSLENYGLYKQSIYLWFIIICVTGAWTDAWTFILTNAWADGQMKLHV
jgi:hypothetical protein